MSDPVNAVAVHRPAYEEIVNNWIWLEDEDKYSRWFDPEGGSDSESVWVCHHCECADADPYERECGCDEGMLYGSRNYEWGCDCEY